MARFGGLGAVGAAFLPITAMVVAVLTVEPAMAVGNHSTDDPTARELKATESPITFRDGPFSQSVIFRSDDTIPSQELDPTDPDTDEDGYWDGWIGVYNVNYDRGMERADTVILYRENLQSEEFRVPMLFPSGSASRKSTITHRVRTSTGTRRNTIRTVGCKD